MNSPRFKPEARAGATSRGHRPPAAAADLRQLLGTLAEAPRVVVLLERLCAWLERRFPATRAAAYAFDNLTGRQVLARALPGGEAQPPAELPAESPLVSWLDLRGVLTSDAANADLPAGDQALRTLRALGMDAALALPQAEGLGGLVLLAGLAAREVASRHFASEVKPVQFLAGAILGRIAQSESHDLVGRISPGARHDLANLMTAPQVCLDLLGDPNMSELASRLRPQAARSLELMRQHITRARQLWERGEKVWSQVEVDGLLASVVAAENELAGKYGVTLRPACPRGLVMQADSVLLTRLLLNLLEHAIATSSAGNSITVEATAGPASESGKESILLTLRRKGHGERAELRWALLDPVFALSRAGESRTSPTLALLVCREIVAWHGGRIAVPTDSEDCVVAIGLPARQNGASGSARLARTGSGN